MDNFNFEENKSHFIMTRNIIPLFVSLSILLVSCYSDGKSEYLTEQEAEKIAAEYLYFSKDGYTLKLTEKEAKEKRISPEHYNVFEERTKQFNENFTKQLDTLGNNKLHFYFSLDKVDTAGLDSRLIIIDITKGKKIDMELAGKEKP